MTQTYRPRRTIDSAGFKTDLLRLQVELKQRVERSGPLSVEYLKKSVSRLRQLRGTRFADLRFDCLLKCVPILYANGEHQIAIQACSEMLTLARTAERRDWLRIAENCAGVVEGERGNVSQAVVHYASALSIARELGDVSAEAPVLANLGMLLQYAGLYRDAVPCHLKAIQVCMGSNFAYMTGAAYTNLAQTFLAMGDVESAYKAISTAFAFDRPPTNSYDAHRRVIREWTYIDVALERGDIKGAHEHLAQCKTFALHSSNGTSLFLARLAQGLCEVAIGSPEDGLKLLERSHADSRHLDEALRADAAVALVKGYQRCGQAESALSHLNSYMCQLVDRRSQQISALLGAQLPHASPQSEYMDLHAWKYREAQLRAAVLENEVVNSRQEMLERLAATATLKEDPSGEHGYRVGKLSALLAEKRGWPRDKLYLIETAARLHDIGKVGVPDRILLGSEQLHDAERQFMQSHTTIGAELLAKSNVPQLKMAEEIARNHHEWWNGAGYPSGLSGERIPLHARIVALADVFDALTHGRPYAAAWSIDDALAQIGRLSGSQFDPDLTSDFFSLVRELVNRHRDLDAFLGGSAQGSAFLQARKNLRSLLDERHETLKSQAVV